jgi:Cu+-exporting ATPase
MITGDHEKTAAAVARQAGVETWAAGVRPEEKVDWIRKYQKQGKKVAMIGDGINDAAALKSADVGIAIGTGTDLAIENADMVIVEGDLRKVLDAITISRATFKKIRQNLFWAFFYNVVAIPLAMSGILYPAIAEGAMMFSSINVILNSLGIKKRIRKEELAR